MAHYQAQTQWKNEIQQNSDGVYEKDSHETVKRNIDRKQFLLVLGIMFLTVLAVTVAVYHFAWPIEGVWVRQEDDVHVAGMVVKVERVNGALQGTIIAMDEGVGVFEVGLVKWMNIKKVGFGRYEWYDLLGKIDRNSTTPFHYENDVSHCTVSGNGHFFNLLCPTDGPGKYQVWIKQKG